MNNEFILNWIDQRVSELEYLKELLSADSPVAKNGPVTKPHKARRKLSAKGLANIRAGVRKRWAKAHAA